MSNYRRAHIEGGTFFFTAVTHQRRPIFKDESAVDLLRKSFRYATARRPFLVQAMVILPDHLHCLWTLPPEDQDFSVRWRLLKTDFSRHYSGNADGGIVPESMVAKKELGIWQRRFWEHVIRDQDDFNRHCDYVHYNPVKHGLVKTPAEWKHSSFGRFVENGIYPSDWGEEAKQELAGMDLE